MGNFTREEISYFGSGLLGRIATVGGDGTPHMAPVGFSYNEETDSIDIGGRVRRFSFVEPRCQPSAFSNQPKTKSWRLTAKS